MEGPSETTDEVQESQAESVELRGEHEEQPLAVTKARLLSAVQS